MTHSLVREKILSEYTVPDNEENFEFNILKYNGLRNSKMEPQGEGKAKLENGYRYEGGFRKGLPHGKGRLALQEGLRYDGHWRKGLKHGMGRIYYPDCSWYQGEFRKDLRNGCGTYYYPNGARYEGNWFRNRRHGMGCYKFSVGNINVNGTWVDGVARGPVEVIMDGCRFHGYWDGCCPRGPGYFTFNAKVMVKGKFYVDEIEGCEEKKLIWQPEAFETYEYTKLPLEPIPFPIEGSDISETSDEEDCKSHGSSVTLSD
ncbi:radial spoke head 1 homolog [Toxorhynchites rutilus septentrionalis]|uniref:radial spoke head 1 homolog n=1 Tax=Toxorhynchites rutilus septentrionalis TaxID=329112 RepID=UPI0024790EFE|nr:radial spoke head 1 homolog [Toxorhynchites rutilus septentrionalis]